MSTFSNHTSYDIWAENWCYVCLRDAPFRNGISNVGCPILLKAMMGEQPAEWIEQEGIQDYHCIEFRAPGDGGGREPKPKPTPRGQGVLFPAPERSVRMLVPTEIKVDAR